ncbi:mechanosensitive ion channel [Flavitalea sp. BT771]|uniref:mechanosensitive ion channel family protein n=1 Tax=Flavitalea sp. BT771 TaxID=3063329 RepID=UPI0026E3F7FB|nr:mechanosensitive ion channel domain-containing protein [Flavitalea sp. BT771]MDO6434121.1 mechanosensitive ion channel [Flavitalea sp. BT771]MDV6223021.1 mechanosensitive ion channel [Flavitalea sp. BT771]
MHNFWNQIVLGNPLRAYIIVVATILFVIILKRFISRLIARSLFRLIRRMGSGLDKSAFLDLVVGPIGTFLVVFVSVSSLEKLHLPPDLDFDIYEVKSRTIIQGIAVIIMVVSFIWLLLRLVDFIALVMRNKSRRSGGPRDMQMVVFLRDFLKVIIGIIGLLMILDSAFKVDVTKILASLGLAGAAVALAAKESIENLIASFVIFFDKPFTAGDVLKVNNISGTVERIGLRSTRIRTDQKTYVTVPNKQMVDSIVDNLTLRTQRKGELRLEIGLSTSSAVLDKLIEGLKEILKKDTVEKSTAFLNDITASAFLINVDYFTAPITQDEFNDVKQTINLDALRLLETLKVDIAGASTDIRLSGAGLSVGSAKS